MTPDKMLNAIRAIADSGGRRIETAMDACDKIVAICDGKDVAKDGGRMDRPPLVARLSTATRETLEELYESMDALGDDALEATALRTLLDWYDHQVVQGKLAPMGVKPGALKFVVKHLNMQNRWMDFQLPDCPPHFDSAEPANAALQAFLKKNRAENPDYWKLDVTMVQS